VNGEEVRPDSPAHRFLSREQVIRSHAVRAAATFLAGLEYEPDEERLFKLAGRIARYIERGGNAEGRR
jgi:hypothetical protein